MKPTTMLRQLLQRPKTLVAPGCVDPMSARVAEHLGFEAVYISGSASEAALFGHPDLGLKTVTEITGLAGRIADAVEVPVICDAEAGFGSAINVARTVKLFEKAGVAAVHIEDQVTPPNSPDLKPRRILAREEAIAKIKAAVDARTDADFVIIARSDADEISIEEAIARCNLYLEAGADLAMPITARINGRGRGRVPFDQFMDLHRKIVKEVRGPVLGLSLPDGVAISQIEELGYKVYIYPTHAHQAAVAAVFELFSELKGTGTVKGYFERRPRLDGKVYRQLTKADRWLTIDSRYRSE